MVRSCRSSIYSNILSLCGLIRHYSIFWVIVCAPGSSPAKFLVITPEHLINTTEGAEAVFFCHLSPPLSAANMEIRWFRSQYHSPVHLYRKGKDENDNQLPEYQGRTELITDNIHNGSVGLRIRNISIPDEGQYRCFFEDPVLKSYEEGILELSVTVAGSPLHIHVVGHHDGGILVRCRSSRWYPEPKMDWKREDGKRLASASDVTARADGSFDIENSLTVHKSSNRKLSCCIRNKLGNCEKSVDVTIDDVFFPRVSPWMIFFCVYLAGSMIGVLLATLYIRKKSKRKVVKLKKKEETIGLLETEIKWRKAYEHRESVTFDERTAYNKLLLSLDSKKVQPTNQALTVPTNEERFDTEPCILGLQRFTEGKHYWEVEVQEKSGRFWSAGVAEETIRRKGGFRESPDSGIFVLRATQDEYLPVSTDADPIHLTERLHRIGVFLDFEGRQLVFFNALSMQHVFTFKYSFTTHMVPFFYIGQGTEFTVL
ncbi:butyrophilin subfamily 1 member A1-like [Pleurodeles waltl]|uniref:butyrophilin subfamily 1 member A1-like n=1 Tax=Pleurodeles waltl TaxID=8319 RepID=UPI00370996D3